MGRHRHRKLLKRLLIVAGILVVLVVGAVGARYLLRKNPGVEQQQRSIEAHNALKDKDFDKARLLLAKLVEELPHKVELRLSLAQCHMGLGQPAEAQRHLREVLNLKPNHGRAHLALAILASARGEIDAAIESHRSAVEGTPYPPGGQYLLSRALLAAGRNSEGIDALIRAVEMEEGGERAELELARLLAGENPDNAATVRARQTLLKLLDQAKIELEKAPDDGAANLRHSQLAMIADRPEDAVSALVRLSTRRSLTTRERMLLGRAYAATGSVARARELIAESEAAAAAGGEDPLTAPEIASSWLLAAKPQQALEIIEPPLAEDPGNLRLLHLKMRALWMLKGRATPGGAVDLEVSGRIGSVATSILAIRPSDERALKYRGVVRLARGDTEGALADADALKRTAPNSPAGYWLDGLTLLSGGHPMAALPHLVRGRDSATSSESGARWIARAAVWAGEGVIATREVVNLKSPTDAALRAGAKAVSGDLDGAEAMTKHRDFREAPIDDRGRLALVLASRGRPDYAGVVAEDMHPSEGDAAGLLRLSELQEVSGDLDAARASLELAARGQGAGKIRALMKLSEEAFDGKDVDRAALAGFQRRLRAAPGGEPFAQLLEGLASLMEGDADQSLAIARDVEQSRLAQPGARVLALSAMVNLGVRGKELADAAARVLEVAPHHRQAREIRAQSMMLDVKRSLGEGDLGMAEEQMSDLLELSPGRGGVQMLRGVLRTRLGEDVRAEEDARELLGSPRTEASGHLLMGIINYRRGAVPGAIREFEACLRLSPESPGALAALSVCLIMDGKAGKALPLADRLEKLEPDGIRHLTIRAGALSALERSSEAIAVLRQHLVDHPGRVGVRVMLGRLLQSIGKYSEAVGEFEAAVKSAPRVAATRSHLVTACIAAGQTEAAMAHAQDTMGTEGLEVQGLLLRSLVKRTKKDVPGELADLHAAVQRAPAHSIAREMLGVRLLAEGSPVAARRELEKACELSPGALSPRLRLASLAEIENRILDAVVIYEQILRQYPGHVIASNNLAYRLAGDPRTSGRAVELARMAAGSVPENGDIQDTLAFALSSADHHEEAVRAAEKAMKLLPKEARIAVSAARVFRDAGAIEKAVRAANRAMSLARKEEREQIQTQIEALHLPSIRK